MNKKSNMADGCPFEESINYLILASWWLIATRCGFISTFLKHLNFDWPYHLGRCFTGFARRPESRAVVSVKFPWPGKSWQMCLVPEGPANLTARSYKVVESARPYTMYMVSNCCLSLYFNIAGLWQVLENASGLPEKSGNFCSQESGNR